MELKLYVVDIRELENTDFCSQALGLLDPARKEKAMRAKNKKDRARLAGAGLLLLLAHEGLPGSLRRTEDSFFPGKKWPEDEKKWPEDENSRPEAGETRARTETAKKGGVPNESLQILSPALIIQTIVDEEEKRGYPLSEGISYKIADRGKPAWEQDTGQEENGQGGAAKPGRGANSQGGVAKPGRDSSKQRRAAYPYFSISHSGDYAALAAADVPVGIDIQEPRRVLHQSIGDYRKFSRMESYFKCTGRGIDLKIDACYREAEEAEKSGRYVFRDIPMPEEYALWVCADVRHPGSRL